MHTDVVGIYRTQQTTIDRSKMIEIDIHELFTCAYKYPKYSISDRCGMLQFYLPITLKIVSFSL